MAYQQDRYNHGGGANANYMKISVNDGSKFGEPIPLATVRCFGGSYDIDTDPRVTVTNNGDIYFSSVPYDITDPLI